jgi:hypothetical protein
VKQLRDFVDAELDHFVCVRSCHDVLELIATFSPCYRYYLNSKTGSEAIFELSRYVKLRTSLVDKLMVLRVKVAEVAREKQQDILRAKRASNWKVTDQELEEDWNTTDQGKQEVAWKQLVHEAESMHRHLNDVISRLRAGENEAQQKKAIND